MLCEAAAASALLLLLSAAGLSAGCAPSPLTSLLGAAPALPPCEKLPAAPPPSRASFPAGKCPCSAGRGSGQPSPAAALQYRHFWNSFTPDLLTSSHEDFIRIRVVEEVFPCYVPRTTPPPKESNNSAEADEQHKTKRSNLRSEDGVCPRRSDSRHIPTVSDEFIDPARLSKLSCCGCGCTPLNERRTSPPPIANTPTGRPEERTDPLPEACDLENLCNVLRKIRSCSLCRLPTLLCRAGGGGGAGPVLRGGGGPGACAEHARGRRRRSDVAGAILALALAGVVALVAVAVLAALLTAVVTAALVVAAWDSDHRPTLPVGPRRPSSTR